MVVVEKMQQGWNSAGIVSSLGLVFPLLPLSSLCPLPSQNSKELFPVSSPAPVNNHCFSTITFEINN